MSASNITAQVVNKDFKEIVKANNNNIDKEFHFVSGAGELELKKQKLYERIFLLSTLTILCALGIYGYFTEGKAFRAAISTVLSFEEAGKHSTNAALNCKNPKNKNTPYCVEREESVKDTWAGITRNKNGHAPAFSLTSR